MHPTAVLGTEHDLLDVKQPSGNPGRHNVANAPAGTEGTTAAVRMSR